jgi:hypothetical protein
MPKCKECKKSDKVVIASYKLRNGKKDKYFECERCNCVVKRISKFKID